MKPSIVMIDGTGNNDSFEFMYSFAGALEAMTGVDVVWDELDEIEKNIVKNDSHYEGYSEQCIVLFLSLHEKDSSYPQTIYDLVRKLFPEVGIVMVWSSGTHTQFVNYLAWENCAPLRFHPDNPSSKAMEHGKFFRELHKLVGYCIGNQHSEIESWHEEMALHAVKDWGLDQHTLDIAYTNAKSANRKEFVKKLLGLYRMQDLRPPDITEEEWNPEEDEGDADEDTEQGPETLVRGLTTRH